MPGLLRSNALCPRCGEPLEGLVDTSSTLCVIREYFHQKRGLRRPTRCKFRFFDHKLAHAERYALEVHV
jgi:hypothetical protein